MTKSFHSDDESWSQAVTALRGADHVTVLTGAGISAESGIATFRDQGGFWTRFPPDDFAHWKGLLRMAFVEPTRLAEFLVAVLEPIASSAPNPGHLAIAALERRHQTTVITQNIDRLHQAAGSGRVLEIHGSLFEIVNGMGQQPFRTLTRQDLQGIVQHLQELLQSPATGLSLFRILEPLIGVSWSGMYRPNLILFGEQMAEPDWTQAQAAARNCDLLLCVGTSRSVYPAALLIDEARDRGIPTLVVDPEIRGGDIWLCGNAGDILPRLIHEADG